MIKLLRGAGLTGWVVGYRTAGFVLDFAFPTLRVAIEVDGWAWHWDVERFRSDRRRQNTVALPEPSVIAVLGVFCQISSKILPKRRS